MTSEKIPCGWRVSNQIRLAAVNFPRDKNNQKHYPDLGTDTHQYGISAPAFQTLFREETRNVGCFLRLHRGELETRVKIDGLVRGGGGNIFLSRFILISYKSLRGKLIQECSKVHGFLLQACTVPYLSYCPRLFPSWMLKTACNENYWSAEYTGAYHFTRKRLTSSPQNSISVPLCT